MATRPALPSSFTLNFPLARGTQAAKGRKLRIHGMDFLGRILQAYKEPVRTKTGPQAWPLTLTY